MQLEPYDEKLSEDETLQITKEERASFLARAAAYQAALVPCPVCGLSNPPEQLVCLRCQSDLAEREITCNIGPSQPPPGAKVRTVGEVILCDQDSIIFEIGSTEIRLPSAPILTIGRQTTAQNSEVSHVDLTLYDAWEKGVSRKHIEIHRRNMLLYVIDLGTTNGSLLNGRRLYPHAEHLLRNGDELQLSRLSIKVKF
jgi:hypothetical protein